MMKHLSLACLLVAGILISNRVNAQQSVSIGTTTTDSDAVLLLVGDGNQGLIIPKVANNGSFGKSGMLVFNTTDNEVYYHNGSTWIAVGGSSTGSAQTLTLAGNTITISGGNSITLASNPVANAVYMWNGTSWAAVTLGGDVSNSSGAITVNGLKGKTLPPLPSTSQSLAYDGTAWVFQSISGGLSSALASGNIYVGDNINNAAAVALNGDATLSNTGTITIATDAVTTGKIKDGTIAAADLGSMSATNGQVLQYNGTVWTPTTLASGGDMTKSIYDTNADNIADAAASLTTTLGLTSGGTGSTTAAGARTNLGLGTLSTLNTVTTADITDGTIAAADLSSMSANSGQVLQYNGSAWVPASLAGSSLGNLTTATTGVTITGGTGAVTGSGATVNIQNATASQPGLLTAADFTTFNSKLGTGTTAGGDLTGTYPNPTIGTGKVTSTHIADGTIAAADLNSMSATSGQVLQYNGSAWAPASIAAGGTVTNVTGTLPISVATGSTTPVVSISQAGSTTNGYLSSIDWNTFNNKQGTLNLTTTGTSGAATLVGNTLNVPNYTGTSYLAGTGLTLTTNTFSVNTSQNISSLSNLTTNGLIKTSGGTGALSIATVGTDYLAPTGNGSALTNLNAASVTSGTLPTARLNVGTGANQLVQLDGTGKLPAVDGSQLTNIPLTGTAGGDLTGSYPNPAIGAGKIVDAQISGTAAIAGSKVNPSFGAQNISTTGTLSSGVATVSGLTIGSTSVNWPVNASGILTNNGTGTLTWTAPFSNPMTTAGDIIYGGVSGVTTRLAGATGILKSNGTTPSWGTIVDADVNSAAAIAGSKVNPNFGSQNISTSGTITTGQFIANKALSGDALVTAHNTATVAFSNGVYGETDSPNTGSAGVWGNSAAGGMGIIGTSNSNYGVYGSSSTGTGIYGTTSSNVGGNYAIAGVNSGTGDVAGFFSVTNPASTFHGVFAGASGSGSGIYGSNNGTTGNAATFMNFNAGNPNPVVQIFNNGTGPSLSTSGPLKIVDGTQGAGKVLTSDAAGLATWQTIAGGGNMINTNNLSDVANVGTSRTNLGLGTLATLSTVASAEISDGTIANIDISTTAAIAGSKITPAFGAQNISTTGTLSSGAATVSSLTIGSTTVNWPANAAGILSNNGTGTLAWSPAFINPMTTNGDIIYQAAGVATRLAGATGFLKSNGTTPTWSTLAVADIPNLDASKITTGTLPTTLGGTGITFSAGSIGNGQILIGDNTAQSFSKANLTAGAGINITNGTGTITINSTAMANPLTTTGDIIYGVGTTPTRLAGAAGFLKSTGAAAPTWSTLVATDIPNLDASKITTGSIAVINGGTGATTVAGAQANLGILPNTLSSGNIFVGSVGNIATPVTMSVDATISNTGALTIANGAISGGTAGKIADATITDADISLAAAIAGSKINSNFGSQDISTTGNLIVSTGLSAGTGNFAVAGTGNFTKINNVPISFPGSQGALNSVLTNDGSGNLSWAAGSGWGLTGNALAGGEKLGSTNGNPLPFITNNVERMRIDAAGKVGIGTVSPAYPMDIVGTTQIVNNTPGLRAMEVTSSVGDAINVSATGTGNTKGIQSLATVTGNYATGVLGTAISDDFSFGVSGTASGTGNFNYGVQAIANGSATTNYGIYGNAINGSTNWAGYFAQGNVHITNGLSVGATPGTYGTAGQVLTSAGPGLAPTWSPAGALSGGISNYVARWTGTSTVGTGTIFDDGTNVGIGTLTPASKLDVAGGITASSLAVTGTNISIGAAGFLVGQGSGNGSNTAMGYANLWQNAGTDNTGFGYTALYGNVGGSRNTGMGRDALGTNTSGNDNTAFGLSALVSNVTGSSNTALGKSADVLVDGLTNATAIGYNAKVGASNSLVLGGTGADAVKVGIGTTTPISVLDVTGDVHLAQGGPPTPTTDKLYNMGGSLFWNGTNISSGGGSGAGNGLTVNGPNLDLGGTIVSGTTKFTSAGDNLMELLSTASPQNSKSGFNLRMDAGYTGVQYELYANKNDATPNSGSSDFIMAKLFSTAGGNIEVLKIDGNTNNLVLNGAKTSGSPYGNVLISNGFFGINTTAPLSTVEVRESLNGDRVFAVDGRKVSLGDFDGGGAGGYMFVDGDGTGNVGIGTLAPIAKLDVVGGDINTSGEIHRATTGAANMVPIAYGSVNTSGGIQSGTGNFSVANPSSGVFNITITAETYSDAGYMTMVTVLQSGTGGQNNIAFSRANGGMLQITVITTSGATPSGVWTGIHFVVYKP